LHQIVREKSNLNARFDERRVSVHRLILIRHTVNNSCDLAGDQAFSAGLLRRLPFGARFQRRIDSASRYINFVEFLQSTAVFKDGVGFDPAKLIQSATELVGLR
jgi:hypothetical protein